VSYLIAAYAITAAALVGYAWKLLSERRSLRGGRD
jgi:hypothetical protein